MKNSIFPPFRIYIYFINLTYHLITEDYFYKYNASSMSIYLSYKEVSNQFIQMILFQKSFDVFSYDFAGKIIPVNFTIINILVLKSWLGISTYRQPL